MRQPIKFLPISEYEQYSTWQKFADSFGHTTEGTMPIVTMSRGDRMFGYYHPINQPVIAPAFHTDPMVCTPRDFREAMEAISNAQCLSSVSNQFPNGVCYMAGPPESERATITDQMIQSMGFEDTGLKIYRRVP